MAICRLDTDMKTDMIRVEKFEDLKEIGNGDIIRIQIHTGAFSSPTIHEGPAVRHKSSSLRSAYLFICTDTLDGRRLPVEYRHGKLYTFAIGASEFERSRIWMKPTQIDMDY